MSRFRDRCAGFVRGLYVGGIGAGIGLIIFFAAYLWMFSTRGPLTAMNWFSPGFSIAAVLQSFAFVTTAGILGRRFISIWRIVVASCLGLLVALLLMPLSDAGSRLRKERLMVNPLFEVDYVWFIFAFNVVAIAASYASTPCRIHCSQTVDKEENIVQ